MRRIILVKHAQPVLDPGRPAHEWVLGEHGDAQAHRLAALLEEYAPFHLATSPEPKAMGTSEVVTRAYGIPARVIDGLREIDRPALPIMSPDEHARFNEALFVEPDRRVIGAESAREARDRFGRAMAQAIAGVAAGNLVVISHGTVIALWVAQHNAVDAFEFWRGLACASLVVLDERFQLLDRRVPIL